MSKFLGLRWCALHLLDKVEMSIRKHKIKQTPYIYCKPTQTPRYLDIVEAEYWSCSSTHEAEIVPLLHLTTRGLTNSAGLTAEVVHEAGLGCDDPLSSCLTENGDVVLGLLLEWGQPTAQLSCCCEDLLIGEPVVLAQDQLQRRRRRAASPKQVTTVC